MAEIIKGMKLSGGTELDVENLSNMALKKLSVINSDTGAADPSAGTKNNLIAGYNAAPTSETYGIKNTDIKAVKSVRLWPGKDGSSAAEIDLMGDGAIDAGVSASDVKQIHIKAMISKEKFSPELDKNKVIRLKQTCSELELNNKNTDGVETNPGSFDLKIKHDDDFQDLKLKARSTDIRCNATAADFGKGGGLAFQTASADANMNENKFKFETSRKVDSFAGLPGTGASWSAWYYQNGGDGIEIGTLNSQYDSFYTKEIRRAALSTVYAAKRSAVATGYTSSSGSAITLDLAAGGTVSTTDVCSVTSGSTTSWYGAAAPATDKLLTGEPPSLSTNWTFKKADYVTQDDDTKDIKYTGSSTATQNQGTVLFVDLINAALWLKYNVSKLSSLGVSTFPNNDSVTDPENIQFVVAPTA